MKKKGRRGNAVIRWIQAGLDGPLDVVAAFVAGGLAWSLILFVTGILNLVWGYGQAFLDMMSGLYPGYAPGSTPTLLLLVIYGILDGGFCAGFLAFLYNKLSDR
jgi:hypothetical protein